VNEGTDRNKKKVLVTKGKMRNKRQQYKSQTKRFALVTKSYLKIKHIKFECKY